ncbi:hypothetical protein J3E68DRAFT_267428 [Trichoderma sp. SZMC 28012]
MFFLQILIDCIQLGLVRVVRSLPDPKEERANGLNRLSYRGPVMVAEGLSEGFCIISRSTSDAFKLSPIVPN